MVPVSRFFVFPGQGAQHPGMGRGMAERFPEAAALYARASEVLGYDLATLCFIGPEDELRRTSRAQPALLVTSLACLVPLTAAGVRPDLVAGHSLGEYTALVAAGALAFEDGVRLLARRGELMEEAGSRVPGSMAAVLGLDAEALQAVCEPLGVVLANRNAPGQVVISGARTAVEQAGARAAELGARRVVPLNVSAAFHSPLMAEAAREMERALAEAPLRSAAIPLIANTTASPVQAPAEIRAALVPQMVSTVRWEESVRRAISIGADTQLEVGAGNVLSGLARRIDRGLNLYTINDPDSASAALAALL
jgi:[acyl-carrier-protein] S-malonyltransferase